jgi:Domain of unknown function (DUF5615)
VKVRFQADNDLRRAIVRGVVRSEAQIDFNSAQAARLDGVPDPEVLALSADAGRILVSHDFQTIPGHFQRFAVRGYCWSDKTCRSERQWRRCY